MESAPATDVAMDEAGNDGSQTDSVVTEIVDSLQSDPTDRSRRLRGRLASLDVMRRRDVLTQVRGQVSPARRMQLDALIAESEADRGPATEAAPEPRSEPDRPHVAHPQEPPFPELPVPAIPSPPTPPTPPTAPAPQVKTESVAAQEKAQAAMRSAQGPARRAARAATGTEAVAADTEAGNEEAQHRRSKPRVRPPRLAARAKECRDWPT